MELGHWISQQTIMKSSNFTQDMLIKIKQVLCSFEFIQCLSGTNKIYMCIISPLVTQFFYTCNLNYTQIIYLDGSFIFLCLSPFVSFH